MEKDINERQEDQQCRETFHTRGMGCAVFRTCQFFELIHDWWYWAMLLNVVQIFNHWSRHFSSERRLSFTAKKIKSEHVNVLTWLSLKKYLHTNPNIFLISAFLLPFSLHNIFSADCMQRLNGVEASTCNSRILSSRICSSIEADVSEVGMKWVTKMTAAIKFCNLADDFMTELLFTFENFQWAKVDVNTNAALPTLNAYLKCAKIHSRPVVRLLKVTSLIAFCTKVQNGQWRSHK